LQILDRRREHLIYEFLGNRKKNGINVDGSEPPFSNPITSVFVIH